MLRQCIDLPPDSELLLFFLDVYGPIVLELRCYYQMVSVVPHLFGTQSIELVE